MYPFHKFEVLCSIVIRIDQMREAGVSIGSRITGKLGGTVLRYMTSTRLCKCGLAMLVSRCVDIATFSEYAVVEGVAKVVRTGTYRPWRWNVFIVRYS